MAMAEGLLFAVASAFPHSGRRGAGGEVGVIGRTVSRIRGRLGPAVGVRVVVTGDLGVVFFPFPVA